MKNIKDYFGTKTAIKCENEQQWEKLKELCGDRYKGELGYTPEKPFFCLYENFFKIGYSLTKGSVYDFKILPYSDFVCDVPELVGVEMEVSDNGKDWTNTNILGKYRDVYVGFYCNWKHARPIQPKKVLTATLSELAEMLNVDEIQIK